jgi:response regulator RpfG family c-di-GMP phosphodiesterase
MAQHKQKTQSEPGKQIRMLSIDDRMLTTDLDRAGYRNMGIIVRHVTSFNEAQQILNSEQIDIIVINLDYEKIDALGVAKHFKSHEPINKIPIVITSVQTTNAAKKSADAAGADLFIEQPLPRQYFIEKLKKLLDKSTRSDDRIEIQERVQIKFLDKVLSLPIADLSNSGMLVLDESAEIAEGSIVNIKFSISGQKKAFEIVATAVRRVVSRDHHKREGVGLRFDKFSGDGKQRLEKYLAKSSSAAAMQYYL